jgi:hypothetical protein
MANKLHCIALTLAATFGLASGMASAEGLKTDSKAELDRGVPGVDVDVDARGRMGKLDTNKDNKISKAEAKADKKLSGEFAKLDADSSGTLDRGEFSKFDVEVDIGEPGDQPNKP